MKRMLLPVVASLVIALPAIGQTVDAGVLKLSDSERRHRISRLGESDREFLRLAGPIIPDAELDAFLILDEDEDRERAISKFWTDRAAGERVSRWRADYEARLEEARQLFESLDGDRALIYLLRGRPSSMTPVPCADFFKATEVWSYETLPTLDEPVHLIFFRDKPSTPFRLLAPDEDESMTLDERILSDKGRRIGPVPIILGIPEDPDAPARPLALDCPGGRDVLAGLELIKRSPDRISDLLDRSIHPRRKTTSSREVELRIPDGTGVLPVHGEVDYPGKRGGRTIVSLRLTVARSDLATVDRGERELYALRVRGEARDRNGIADRFRYDFELAPGGNDEIDLVIERFLPPYDYELTVHLADEGSGSEGLVTIPIEVPYIDPLEREAAVEERTAMLAEMEQQFREGESTIRIVPLGPGFFTGKQRFETLLTGHEIASVDFWVGDRKVMSKRSAPYTLELDLGEVPTMRSIRVVGRDREGRVISGDELVVNGGSDPFRVRIVSPRLSEGLSGETRVEVVAHVPADHDLESLELFLNDERVAIGYESPLIQMIDISSASQTTFIRAVATIDDELGSQAEDVVLLNAPEMLEQVDVRLVELPTTVIRNRDVVDDLDAVDFEVYDEGERVAIEKFDYVRDLPLSIGMAIDSSGSMHPRMSQALRTGARFFERVLKPGDKAFLLAFNDEARMVQRWTDRFADLTAGLSSLEAEEMTALYDAVIHALYNFQGLRGQKALIILSDGQDTASKFSFSQVLEYARRGGIPIYTIGLGIKRDDVETRSKLTRLAEETGAESYFIEVPGALGDVYDEIELTLRSQYILGFYPSVEARESGRWRRVEVKVDGASAKTVRGYYP